MLKDTSVALLTLWHFQIDPRRGGHVARRCRKDSGKGSRHFLRKAELIVRAVWPNGGSPDAQKMWDDAGGKSPYTVKGKKLLSALKVVAKANGKDEKLLDAFTIPGGFEVASDLRAIIEAASNITLILRMKKTESHFPRFKPVEGPGNKSLEHALRLEPINQLRHLVDSTK